MPPLKRRAKPTPTVPSNSRANFLTTLPPIPLQARLQTQLNEIDLAALANIGIQRDPGSYNLMVHFLPPEVAKDHTATEDLQSALMKPTGPVCLYLHIAPCTGRCTFCHYAIEVNPSEDRLERYLSSLEQEMEHRWAGNPNLGDVRSVLIGGGTPTYLEADQLDRLLTAFHRTVKLPKGIEFTVESAPETLTAAKLETLLRHGVNRLNVGTQSFDDDLLRGLGRRHDGEGAEDAIKLAKEVGFKNVNIDLIYALPEQTVTQWVDSLDIATDLEVQSITTYHLRKRPDTRISRRASPSEHTNILQHLASIERLKEAGYRQSLSDYFCLDGMETAQEQARDKWRDMMPVDGCGMEACSRRPDLVAFNHGTMDTYNDAVGENDGWALAHGRILTPEEQMAQRAMFALKVLDEDGGLDRAGFEAEFETSVDEVFGATIDELCTHRLLEDGARVRLTELGSLFADEVCNRFYTPELKERMTARIKVQAEGAPVRVPRGTQKSAIDTADVVVVGGGIAGIRTAADLARDLGAGVLLLEQAKTLGTGATGASVGGIRAQHLDPFLAELTLASLPEFDALKLEGAHPIDYQKSGYLFMATTDEDAAVLNAQANMAGRLGITVHELHPMDAATLVSGVNINDITYATWSPTDGQVDPHGLVQCYAHTYRENSGRMRMNTTVTELAIERGRVVGVHTTEGLISAQTVVLAAGPAVGTILRQSGVTMPLKTGRRRVYIGEGEGVPTGKGPLVWTPTPALYFRPESNGVVISACEQSVDQAGEEDNTLDRLEIAMERAIHRIPALKNGTVRFGWSGIQTHTHDGRPFVGPCPGLDGVILVAGLGSHGIMHAPAIGRCAAQWILSSKLGKFALTMDPRRVHLSDYSPSESNTDSGSEDTKSASGQ